MQKKVLIIEDHSKCMEIIKTIVVSLPLETEVYAVSNLKDAYQIGMEENIDLFLVDIILDTKTPGDTSGIDFANNIRQNAKYHYTPIIFITSLEDPRLEAYSKLHCYSYIEKPFDSGKTAKKIEEALKMPLKKNGSKEYVYFRKDGILYGFCIADIIYIKTSGHATIIHSIHEKISVAYHSVERLLKELDSDLFIQCNRGTVINKKYIEYVDPTNRYVKLRNVDSQIEIGIIIKNKFLREIANG